MKIARMQMSCEVRGWDKTLSKYEAKLVKGDTLTQTARSLVESASKLSQETINNNLSLVLAALDQLVLICGNYQGEGDMDSWVEELLMEKESQMEVVGEAVDMLGDRTERLRLEHEKKAEASGGVSSSGEQGSGLKTYVYKSMDPMKPDPW